MKQLDDITNAMYYFLLYPLHLVQESGQSCNVLLGETHVGDSW